MKRLIFIILLLASLGLISGSCLSGQININSASSEELDQIKWVGPKTAENIISSRPFDSVDDLIKVSGIGEIKLQDIKNQGLACVGESDEDKKEETPPNEEEEDSNNSQEIEKEEKIEEKKKEEENKYPKQNTIEKVELKENKPQEIITLGSVNTKDIKSKNLFEESLDKKDVARILLIGFCVLIAFLFLLKYLKSLKYKKNEFG